MKKFWLPANIAALLLTGFFCTRKTAVPENADAPTQAIKAPNTSTQTDSLPLPDTRPGTSPNAAPNQQALDSVKQEKYKNKKGHPDGKGEKNR